MNRISWSHKLREIGQSCRFAVPIWQVAAGLAAWLMYLYLKSLWQLAHSTGGMRNKFSDLAREDYLGFLAIQNLQVLQAYLILLLIGLVLTWPLVSVLSRCSKRSGFLAVMIRSCAAGAILHGFFTLRLTLTRPYFLNDAEFGHWYYRLFEFPEPIRPLALQLVFTVLPIVYLALVGAWYLARYGRAACWVGGVAGVTSAGLMVAAAPKTAEPIRDSTMDRPLNVIVIGSDSLRGDRLGFSGYRPMRQDGPAAAGVSPNLDRLAAESVQFKRCFTSIASTLESGVQVMTSTYPHTHGLRHMYPDRNSVEAVEQETTPIAKLLRDRGYHTAAIGDWCAGYYHLTPLGFEDISVSNFDNFKIYMSQAVLMSHFVVPLYFDNPMGHRIFPQIGSFAQFVTPEVVTNRVKDALNARARDGRPFFWHVFYSCNHLPYRSKEPYLSMFADPDYRGPNRNGVDFDIDEFIGGTDLESKWKALPAEEIRQIRALYDGCTRLFDDCVGQILTELENLGLDENTLVVVTSDHGDDLYEPGVTLGHGLTFNGGLHANHVPLLMRLPGADPDVVNETVRLVDLAPTLAEILDVPLPDSWEGRSFKSWIGDPGSRYHRPFYGETGFPFIQFSVPGIERPQLPPMDEMTWIDESFGYHFVLRSEYHERLIQAKQRCLMTRDWKIVCTPTAQGGRHFGLFHMRSDPDALVDLAAEREDVLIPMRRALERWLDDRVESSIAEIFPKGEPGASP